MEIKGEPKPHLIRRLIVLIDIYSINYLMKEGGFRVPFYKIIQYKGI